MRLIEEVSFYLDTLCRLTYSDTVVQPMATNYELSSSRLTR